MAAFKACDVLSVTTGRLMGDIDGVYEVMSWLMGRDAFTHELAYYGKAAAAAITSTHPSVPTEATSENFRQVLADFATENGETFDLADALAGALSDNKNAFSTLDAMLGSRGAA